MSYNRLSFLRCIMKKKSDGQSAFLRLRLLIGLLAFLSGVGLAIYTDALPISAKRAPKVAQKQTTKAGAQRPDQGFWEQTNGPQGGDGIALATNASGDIFVGTQGGGIFRSTDSGETWTEVNNGLTDTNVRAMAINSAGDIFAGTWSGGVFRSTEMVRTGLR